MKRKRLQKLIRIELFPGKRKAQKKVEFWQFDSCPAPLNFGHNLKVGGESIKGIDM